MPSSPTASDHLPPDGAVRTVEAPDVMEDSVLSCSSRRANTLPSVPVSVGAYRVLLRTPSTGFSLTSNAVIAHHPAPLVDWMRMRKEAMSW